MGVKKMKKLGEARKASSILVSISAVFLGIVAASILILLIGKNPIKGF